MHDMPFPAYNLEHIDCSRKPAGAQMAYCTLACITVSLGLSVENRAPKPSCALTKPATYSTIGIVASRGLYRASESVHASMRSARNVSRQSLELTSARSHGLPGRLVGTDITLTSPLSASSSD